MDTRGVATPSERGPRLKHRSGSVTHIPQAACTQARVAHAHPTQAEMVPALCQATAVRLEPYSDRQPGGGLSVCHSCGLLCSGTPDPAGIHRAVASRRPLRQRGPPGEPVRRPAAAAAVCSRPERRATERPDPSLEAHACAGACCCSASCLHARLLAHCIDLQVYLYFRLGTYHQNHKRCAPACSHNTA